MATPVSGENVVEQYVGRLSRDYEGKENVSVYDYVDSHIPKFDSFRALESAKVTEKVINEEAYQDLI